MTGTALLVLVPGGGFALGSLVWLCRAGFGAVPAGLVVVLAGAQAGIVLAFAGAGHSLWLAFALGGVVASAAAFSEREDARRIILLGGALALVQIVDPLGGLLAAGVVPAAVAMRRRRTDARGAVGLYALLLFFPVATAIALLYASRVLHVEPSAAIGGMAFVPAVPTLDGRLMVAMAPILVALPPLAAARGTAGGRTVGVVAGAALVSAAFGALMGVIREPVTLLAVAAPLSIGAVASLPSSAERSRQAVSFAVACAALSWVAAAAVGG